MLSICIPVFNFDVTVLVRELDRQSRQTNIPFEIILIDDCSEQRFREINRTVHPLVKYVQLNENIGRSRIRNSFLSSVSFESILFLDCDVKICQSEFIKNYVDAINSGRISVVCGGRIFPQEAPSKLYRLRWKYGRLKESQTKEVRIKNANRSFQTNNFLIKRDVLEQIRFDERLTEYGHEDTLFGFELKKRGIEISHIHNPVLNGDLETNIDYLNKTERAVENLIFISKFMRNDSEFPQEVTLLKVYGKLKKIGLLPIIKFLFRITGNQLKFLLGNGYANLILFDFYKLGILTRGLQN